MSKEYYFISIQKVVTLYEQKEGTVVEIPSAVKYSMEQEEFWSWFENNVGDLEGNNAFFLADETLPIPTALRSTEPTYSPRLLQTTLKTLFSETAVTVERGDEVPLTVHSEQSDSLNLLLLYPLEALEEEILEEVEEEEEEEVEVPVEIHVDEGEKSDVKKAFEAIFESYHTNQ